MKNTKNTHSNDENDVFFYEKHIEFEWLGPGTLQENGECSN